MEILITNKRISVISDDIDLKDDVENKYLETVSGDVTVYGCKLENISTVSGDVDMTYSSVQSIESVSGDVTLNNNSICENIETTSGDIHIYDSEVEEIETVSGSVKCINSKVKEIRAYDIGKLDGTTVEKIIVPDRKSIQNISINGNNVISHIDNMNIGDISLNNMDSAFNKIFKGFKMFAGRNINFSNNSITINGQNINIPSKPIEIHLSKTSNVKEIYFEGKGIVYSPYKLKTNGELKC